MNGPTQVLCVCTVVVSLWLVPLTVGRTTEDPTSLLNVCLRGLNHKEKPGPQDKLFDQCLPWQNHSCCTHETTKELHQGNMYNFNWNHCNQPMGDACRRHFVQDLCFYECSPNIGPWLVGVDMKIRKEKPLDVPLCQSECDHWWDDCKSELTCLDNWGKGFNWTGATNTCPMGKPCFSFAHMFRDAQTFCENVWDHSWKVVDDSKPCMKLLFAPSEGNPNNDVAQWKVNQMIANVAPAAPSSVRIAQFLVFCTLSFLL